MRYTTPYAEARGSPKDKPDSGTLYYYPKRPDWLTEWIHNQVRWGVLECGHFCDRNDHSAIVGDKMDCVECGRYIKVARASSLLERFGITPVQYTEPPF